MQSMPDSIRNMIGDEMPYSPPHEPWDASSLVPGLDSLGNY